MDTITYDDFAKLDIRTGTITDAQFVPKSEKLLKLQVDFGTEIGTRTIMAGIASMLRYMEPLGDPTIMVGSQVCAIVNLAPRKLMGIESHGMLLAAHNSEERIYLVKCLGVNDGSKVG